MPKPVPSVATSRVDKLFAVRLMEHLVVPTFVLNADGTVMIWNRACERITGLAAAEVIGTKNHWQAFYNERRRCLADLVIADCFDDMDSLYARHVELGSGQAGLTAENWCLMPQLGVRRYLAFDAGPIYSDSGELLAVVETVRDITVQKEAQAALEALAQLDGLTGLANRRALDERLDRECRRAKREGSSISVLMIDIDHFKQFNDALGHQAGDECLRQIASLIKGEMRRPGDFAARYGGEEFAVLLPGAGVDGARVVADRIHTAAGACAIPHPTSGPPNIVTMSIGIADAVDPEPETLLAEADAGLYRAKRGGRNRTETVTLVTSES